MRDIDDVLAKLAKSSFRQRFKLRQAERAYVARHGLTVVLEHAQGFISKRLAPAGVVNDGKQTPYRGHPVFVAQHATATCCRGCLAKWHRIPPDQPLVAADQSYVLDVLERWLRQELGNDTEPNAPRLL